MKNNIKSSPWVAWVIDIATILLGCFIFAVSINCFTDPNDISPGGVIGIAQLLHDINGWNITWVGWMINAPIFLWAFWEFNWRRLIKNALATVALYPMVDLTRGFLPVYTGNMLLVSLLAAVSGGIGLALIFMRGAATGGTDLLATLTKLYIRHMPVGKILFFIDAIVVGSSAIVYGINSTNHYAILEGAAYAAILIFVQSRVIDAILFGTSTSTGKMMIIISKKSQEISQKILKDINKGATLIKGEGAFSKEEVDLVLSAVKQPEVHKIYDIIKEIDEKAFVFVGSTGEAAGLGFGELEKEERRIRKQKINSDIV